MPRATIGNGGAGRAPDDAGRDAFAHDTVVAAGMTAPIGRRTVRDIVRPPMTGAS